METVGGRIWGRMTMVKTMTATVKRAAMQALESQLELLERAKAETDTGRGGKVD